jgi:putative transposase
MLPAGRIDSAGPLPFGASLGEGEGSHRHLALENLALRQQLAVYKKTLRRPKLHPSDRLFWVSLSRVWAGWRQVLIIVTPDTVLRWHRRCFRDYWAKLSRRPQMGRPPINAEIITLIRKMAAANPLWMRLEFMASF